MDLVVKTAVVGDSSHRGTSISTSPAPKEGIDLSNMGFHPWPTGFSGAVSKLLDDADIPNAMWGDLINWWRGNPHIPQICGYVVPANQLEAAVAVIERAGLPSCDCRSFHHFSDPAELVWLPKHFRVAQPYNMSMTLFLCPSDKLLDLIPLCPSHPNPAALEFDRYALHLYDQYRPVISLEFGAEVPPDHHVVKVLTALSLIKVLILLVAFSPPECAGVDHSYTQILALFAPDRAEQGPFLLLSPSLQRVWDIWYVRMNRSARQGHILWDGVRAEWKDKLSLCQAGPQTG